MSLAEKLFKQAFPPGRLPRSDEYKAGAMAILKQRTGTKGVNCPYREGTVQADAWYAGAYEGHSIYQGYLEKLLKPEEYEIYLMVGCIATGVEVK